MSQLDNPFRSLPSVNDVLNVGELQPSFATNGHDVIVEAIRAELAEIRSQLALDQLLNGVWTAETVAANVQRRLNREMQPRLRPVINATGIVLHTNLGRAPIAEAAAKAAYEAARGYLNLELDLDTGK